MLNDSALAAMEFDLLSHASNYDLSDPQERLRSHTDLTLLFYSLGDALKPDAFVEAGAFNAQASRDMRRRLPSCRAVAFEANPHNYELWAKRIDYGKEGVEYLHKALSLEPGTVTFHVQKSRDGQELKKVTGRSSLLQRTDPTYEYEDVRVAATSLDNFFDPLPEKPMLWIDVEGASRPVLLGGRKLVSVASVVFIEVEEQPFWEGQWLVGDVTRFMGECGLVPVARDFESRSRVQYNMVFLRDTLRRNPVVRNVFTAYHSACAFPRVERISSVLPASRGGLALSGSTRRHSQNP
jgi:FkbM family methyltransferase